MSVMRANVVTVCFDEDTIREHFEDLDPNPLDGLTEGQILEIGRSAATALNQHDGLWALFDEVLEGEISNLRGELRSV